MKSVHVIDSVVFDLSFAARQLAPEQDIELKTWVTDELLPIVNSVLDEFDDADSIQRLGLVEIDLGDILHDNYQTEISHQLRVKLSALLRDVLQDHDQTIAAPMLPVRRVRKEHADLAQMENFLMTGRMDWYIDHKDRQQHERLFERILKQNSHELIALLQKSATQKTVIERLIHQFPEHYLENLLDKITPLHASLILDLIVVYRIAMVEEKSLIVNSSVSIDLIWTSVLYGLLQPKVISASQLTVVSIIMRKITVSLQLNEQYLANTMLSIANRLQRAGKIGSVLPRILLECSHQDDGLTQANKIDQSSIDPPELPLQQLQRIVHSLRSDEYSLSSSQLNIADLKQLISMVIGQSSAGGDKTAFIESIDSYAKRSADQCSYYQQILTALLKDQLVDLEQILLQSNRDEARVSNSPQLRAETQQPPKNDSTAKTVDLLAQYQRIIQALQETNIAELQAIQQALQQPDGIRQLLQYYVADNIIRRQLISQLSEQILVDITAILAPPAAALLEQLLTQSYLLCRYPSKSTTITQVAYKQWKLRLLENSLTYLVTEADKRFEPSDYLSAMARMMSESGEQQPILKFWQASLTATPSKLNELLFAMVRPGSKQRVETIVDEIVVESIDIRPQSLQSIARFLRAGEFSLASFNLKASELRQLITIFVEQLETGGNQTAFIESIDSYTKRSADQYNYYQQIVTALLKDQLVDLEQILLQSNREEALAPDSQLLSVKVPQETANESAVKTVDLPAQYQRVIHALQQSNLAELQVLKQALQQQPDRIRQLLQYDVADQTTRHQLISQLSEQILVDITAILAPSAATLLEQLLAQSYLLCRYPNKSTTITQVAYKQWKLRLLESSLSYLATDAGDRFEPSDYLVAMARMMSKSGEEQPILEFWQASLTATSSKVSELLLAIVNSDLEQRVEPIVVDEISIELPDMHLKSLQSIAQSLRTGKYSVASLELTVSELKQLITMFMQPSEREDNQAVFMRSIDGYATRSADQRLYYQRVLVSLLKDQPVDLEAILMQSDTTHKLTDSELVSTTVAMPKQPHLFIPSAEDDLLQTADSGTWVRIYNGGQIMVAPYLPRLFKILGLIDKGYFLSQQSAERAVHLLQFIVNEQSESPEYQLVLNKILCGIPIEFQICRGIDISAQEKRVIEDLIQGMIQNWKAIGNTSIKGFRETFLQREGGLLMEEDAWQLSIEPGTFDMLLDSLPWSFSIIKHSWMTRAIHVSWR